MSGSFTGAAHISLSAGGAAAVGSGAFTIAVLLKSTGSGSIVGCFHTGTGQRALLNFPQLFGLGDFSSGFGSLTSGSWYVAVISKPAGSAHYRFGLWAYSSAGTGSMTHGESTGSGNHADGTAIDEIRIGDDGNGDNPHCDISVLGLWTSQLSDAQLDTLVSIHLSAWSALAPAALITLNNWTGTTGATDVVGTSSQSGLTGTVASAADAPSFDFTLSGPPNNGQGFLTLVGVH